MLFNQKKAIDSKISDYLLEISGQPKLKSPDFNNIYLNYSPEQLEELIAALEETIRFLTYQKNLSGAYHQEQFEDVKYLLEKKLSSNLVYLRKDEGWLLRVLQ